MTNHKDPTPAELDQRRLHTALMHLRNAQELLRVAASLVYLPIEIGRARDAVASVMACFREAPNETAAAMERFDRAWEDLRKSAEAAGPL